MVKYDNPSGYIELTVNYFEKLVSSIAKSCFGVTGLVSKSAVENIKSLFRGSPENKKSVIVKYVNGALKIDLHISVSYGVNIKAISDSITHKVKYTVEDVTGLNVSEVNVHVDAVD